MIEGLRNLTYDQSVEAGLYGNILVGEEGLKNHTTWSGHCCYSKSGHGNNCLRETGHLGMHAAFNWVPGLAVEYKQENLYPYRTWFGEP